jgi:serine/threonine protein kinase
LLAELKHPFIVNMVYAFQDRLNLYLVMDYMPGGDLRFQLGRCDKFPENVVKFFVCSILLSLQYLHGNNIIHRDLKPENLIFDAKGYLRLTDLGVARLYTPDNYKDTSGTPGYMAPEVINRENHSFEVDYFALGVIAYECMLGRVRNPPRSGPTAATTGRRSESRCFYTRRR